MHSPRTAAHVVSSELSPARPRCGGSGNRRPMVARRPGTGPLHEASQDAGDLEPRHRGDRGRGSHGDAPRRPLPGHHRPAPMGVRSLGEGIHIGVRLLEERRTDPADCSLLGASASRSRLILATSAASLSSVSLGKPSVVTLPGSATGRDRRSRRFSLRALRLRCVFSMSPPTSGQPCSLVSTQRPGILRECA